MLALTSLGKPAAASASRPATRLERRVGSASAAALADEARALAKLALGRLEARARCSKFDLVSPMPSSASIVALASMAACRIASYASASPVPASAIAAAATDLVGPGWRARLRSCVCWQSSQQLATHQKMCRRTHARTAHCQVPSTWEGARRFVSGRTMRSTAGLLALLAVAAMLASQAAAKRKTAAQWQAMKDEDWDEAEEGEALRVVGDWRGAALLGALELELELEQLLPATALSRHVLIARRIAELRQGDEDELLVNEDTLLAQEYERRTATATVDMAGLASGSAEAIDEASHSQAMQGPTMVFAALGPAVPADVQDGVTMLRRRRLAEGKLEPSDPLLAATTPEALKTWNMATLDSLSTLWQDRLFAAGIEVTVYHVDDRKVMVGLTRGWHGAEVKQFLLGRSEVETVTWDGRDYTKESG